MPTASAVKSLPRSHPIFGHLHDFRRDPLGFLVAARQHGDIVRYQLGPQEAYFLSDPEHVREVLVTQAAKLHKGRVLQRARKVLGDGLLTSEGELHLRQRRMIQPVFHQKRIATYAEAMGRHAATLRDRWQAGTTYDVHQEMMHLTLAIVAETLFSADVAAEADEIGAALTELLAMFDRIYVPLAWLTEKLPLPSTRRYQRARARLDATIYRMIRARRASGEAHGDLLAMLLDAQDEDDGRGMTDQQVRDEALTLFLAGHETTANALTWTFYLLSEHPDAEARLHEEWRRVLGDRPPGLADLPQLVETRRVLQESLRLLPPAWVIGRMAIAEVDLGVARIPAGAVVLVCPYTMHRDPRYFADPERFDPDRWAPEAVSERPKFSYFPFGGGPRVCIGEPFAWMEATLLLATLGQRWRLRLEPGHPVVKLPQITMRPKFGMAMRVEAR
ncbi:MAG TPA: cytochrome P450 [Oscillatoriaceae cyanobacterium]